MKDSHPWVLSTVCSWHSRPYMFSSNLFSASASSAIATRAMYIICIVNQVDFPKSFEFFLCIFTGNVEGDSRATIRRPHTHGAKQQVITSVMLYSYRILVYSWLQLFTGCSTLPFFLLTDPIVSLGMHEEGRAPALPAQCTHTTCFGHIRCQKFLFI